MKTTIHLDKSVNQKIVFDGYEVELFLKREDQIHPHISGNKYRKLKYNLIEAKRLGLKTLLSFGGAFSNHIAAVASVGKELGFDTIGVIRGEELISKVDKNSTLKFARDSGMHLHFISREDYKKKSSSTFLSLLKEEFGDFYMIPEGGTNELAVEGCKEILNETDNKFDYICCSVGTGGTISGLINSSSLNQKILGFPALKGEFLGDEIRKFAKQPNWELIVDYHFGGYAKINKDLVTFINQFKARHGIQLDPIYTGKMMFGIMSLIGQDYFLKGSKILTIHTGGLQGILGMNSLLKKKQLPLIK